MKKTKKIQTTINKTKWFCDLCGGEMAENSRAICTHCRKDVCATHSRHFRKKISWHSGFQYSVGPSISIVLCDECKPIKMMYEDFMDLFFKEVRIHGPSRGI